MKELLLISMLPLLSLLPHVGHAAICFNQGDYSGFGMFKDAKGKAETYQRRAQVKSGSLVENQYKWPGQEVSLNYEVRGDQVYVNQNPVAAGLIACRLGSTSLTLTTSNMRLEEEWVSVGNYLLISGKKVVSGETIRYTELLIKQESSQSDQGEP